MRRRGRGRRQTRFVNEVNVQRPASKLAVVHVGRRPLTRCWTADDHPAYDDGGWTEQSGIYYARSRLLLLFFCGPRPDQWSIRLKGAARSAAASRTHRCRIDCRRRAGCKKKPITVVRRFAATTRHPCPQRVFTFTHKQPDEGSYARETGPRRHTRRVRPYWMTFREVHGEIVS